MRQDREPMPCAKATQGPNPGYNVSIERRTAFCIIRIYCRISFGKPSHPCFR